MRSDKHSPPKAFFATHPVFRYEEFQHAHSRSGKRSTHTSHAVLKQHVAAGNLLRVRRGLYATVPPGASPKTLQLDPYLLASRLAPDAVVAYHAALQFHGKSYSLWSRFQYLSRHREKAFRFRRAEFVAVLPPAPVRDLPDFGGGVQDHQRQGLTVRVTSLERTLVDLFHSPRHGGGWEETWRSLESVEFFDLDAVAGYALKHDSAVTVARVGFFLEQHREQLMVEDRHLKRLAAAAPAHPIYLDRRRPSGRLQKRWNLVVPQVVLNRSWAEVLSVPVVH